MRYAMLLISERQGVGKTTLVDAVLAPLIGRWNVSSPTESQVADSGFNSWIAHKRLAHTHLEVRGDLDAHFIRGALVSGNDWAISEKYPDLLNKGPDRVAIIETREILAVFEGIAAGVGELSPAEFAELIKIAELNSPFFEGFDANEEKDYFTVASFLVEGFDEFEGLRTRPLDAHRPMLPYYRKVVERVRAMKVRGLMTFRQLQEALTP